MFCPVIARFALSFLFPFILLVSTNGNPFEGIQVHDLSFNGTNGTVKSGVKLDSFTHELTAPLDAVAGLQELHERQAPSAPMIVADQARPPTLIYYCGILTQICANIADALSNSRGTDGAYTTTLGYAPYPAGEQGTRTRQSLACSTFATQCASYYACDTVSRRLQCCKQ